MNDDASVSENKKEQELNDVLKELGVFEPEYNHENVVGVLKDLCLNDLAIPTDTPLSLGFKIYQNLIEGKQDISLFHMSFFESILLRPIFLKAFLNFRTKPINTCEFVPIFNKEEFTSVQIRRYANQHSGSNVYAILCAFAKKVTWRKSFEKRRSSIYLK